MRMDIDSIEQYMNRFNPRLVSFALKAIKKIPYLRRLIKDMVRKESASMMRELEGSLKPYRGAFPAFASLPAKGRPRSEILNIMRQLRNREETKWRDGFVSGAVYHGDKAHIEFLNQAYAINSQSNPLHSDVWPSISKYEAEI